MKVSRPTDVVQARSRPIADAAGEGPWRRASTWAALGCLLVGGVVAWRLLRASYKADVAMLCEAEPRSGFTIARDMPKVVRWVRDRMATPEGNRFFSTLADERLSDRARHLQNEASALGIPECPLASAYERLAADGAYRADLQHLCSSANFPQLALSDDETRLGKIVAFADGHAASPRTKELAGRLRAVATPSDRATLLRETASKMDVYSCEVARTLELPQQPVPTGPPIVRVWAAPQIIGPLRTEDLAKGIALVTPALDACYAKGREHKPDLAGRVALKLQVDPDGSVSKAAPAGGTLDDPATVSCLADAVRSIKLASNAGPLTAVFLPLELIPTSTTP